MFEKQAFGKNILEEGDRSPIQILFGNISKLF